MSGRRTRKGKVGKAVSTRQSRSRSRTPGRHDVSNVNNESSNQIENDVEQNTRQSSPSSSRRNNKRRKDDSKKEN